MSKQNAGERIIEIRPIERYVPKEPVSHETLQQSFESIEDRIHSAENELRDLQKKRLDLLQQTEAEIAEARTQWEAERGAYVEAARQEGLETGLTQGRDEGHSEYAELITQANNVLEAAQKDYQATLEKSDHAIIELAIATADKILNKKLEEEPEQFINIVKSAIEEIDDQSTVMINLNPANYETVLNQKDELERILTHDTKLSIYLNEELGENDCIIEHPYGQIDASIDTQLKQIRDILHELALERR